MMEWKAAALLLLSLAELWIIHKRVREWDGRE
jgi:hypothetical protein